MRYFPTLKKTPAWHKAVFFLGMLACLLGGYKIWRIGGAWNDLYSSETFFRFDFWGLILIMFGLLMFLRFLKWLETFLYCTLNSACCQIRLHWWCYCQKLSGIRFMKER